MNNIPNNPNIIVQKPKTSGIFTNYIFKAIPLAFDESMSYYETLCGLLNYLQQTILPTLNNNADAIIELQNLYAELKNYVDNYFTNLDVQEEINNKLDQMSQSGELEPIIAHFLNSTAIFGFNTVTDLKQAPNLINGSYAKTMGYNYINDNGSGLYYITTNPIENDNPSTIQLNNNLYANLVIIGNTITPEQFGCVGNGIVDDTINLQACIDFAIKYKKQIDFTGSYKVSPTLQADGTYLCLKVFRDSTDNSHVNDTSIQFNFIRESKIFTSSTEQCTLLRFNISNIVFNNALLEGTLNNTTLLELSNINKLDLTETQWSCYNNFRNLLLLNCKTAIHMEGNSYYNIFENINIRNCENGIILDFTLMEKQNLKQRSNVNRNDFKSITIQNSTDLGIGIYYGDTNKFTDISFEHCNDILHLDDPQRHLTDYTLKPLWSTEDNRFINIVTEDVNGIPIYNNSGGLKIINITTQYDNELNDLLVAPQIYIGAGPNTANSVEKIMNIFKSLENTPFPNLQKYSTIINDLYGHISKYYSDFQTVNNVNTVLSRRNVLFDESQIVNIKVGTSLTYETNDKCLTKQIGGIVFLSTKFAIQPDNLNANIELPLNENITARNNLSQFGVIPQLKVPVYITARNTDYIIECEIRSNKLVLHPPTDGWGATTNIFLNLHWFRDQLTF